MTAELCLSIGSDLQGPRVVFVPPLFEEANRLRRTLVLAMHALAARGIASLLPDLPGQNDSLTATVDVDLDRWRGALADYVAALQAPVLMASVRGGALVDDRCGAAAWWRMAPAEGASLLRAMLRTRVAGDREAGLNSSSEALLADAAHRPLLLGGNLLSPPMVAQLQSASPSVTTPLRTVMLGDGPDDLAGTPLWLRAEPGEDAAMAEAMAADIALWMQTCGLI